MRVWFALFFVLVRISSPVATDAQQAPVDPAATESALKGERLLFDLPKNFYKAYHSDRIGALTEFVPSGETFENWAEMITIQVFPGLQAEPVSFLQTIEHRYTKTCPGFRSSPANVTMQVNGYAVSTRLFRCPLNSATGKPETTVFRIIKGNSALYSVQYAWRSMATNKEVVDAVPILGSAKVCDPRVSGHPCPSVDVPAFAARPEPTAP